jgi:hypothetical protein
MIDLHSHSTASDGAWTPEQLVAKAAAGGLQALALTDHDSLAGLAEAQQAAGRLGLRFVPGVEIEIAFGPGEFHLLGLDLLETDGPITAVVRTLAASREERNLQVFSLLREAGMDVHYQTLLDISGTGMIGRPHIADLLVRKRLVKSRQEAFDRYLAKGRPFFVQKVCMELPQAVAAIKAAGGLAIVAHPMSLFVSWSRLRTLMAEWVAIGIDGIEAWHPTARVVDCQRLEAMGGEFGLRITAGSDYHGPSRPERRLGYTAGDRPIDDRYLEALKR